MRVKVTYRDGNVEYTYGRIVFTGKPYQGLAWKPWKNTAILYSHDGLIDYFRDADSIAAIEVL